MRKGNIETSLRKLKRAERRNPVLKKLAKVGTTSFVVTGIAQLANQMPTLGTYLMETLSGSVGDAVGEITDSIFANALQEKRNEFLDELANYNGYITPETLISINSVQFILEYTKTLDAIDRLAGIEKIYYIANLFGKYFIKEHHEEVDFYEESLYHLTSLSYREIVVMITLYKYEVALEEKSREQDRQLSEDVMARANVCTDQLIEVAPEKWDMDEGELIGILTSLCGSGFVREVVGAYTGYSGGVFYTTTYLKKFLGYILNSE